MSAELEAYKEIVSSQKEELYAILAAIGLDSDYNMEIQFPDEDTPLADLFVAAKIAADNLKLVVEQLEEKIKETEAYTRTIEDQRAAIMELSTPVIQLMEGILVIPLIGTIDTYRATQITEQLLQEISSKQAEAVIIDVTGVYIIDTMVAAHLVKTIQAARMLGAECVVTGISPENAQTLVSVGVSGVEMLAKGSLQTGLEHALDLTNRAIAIKESDSDE